MENNIKNIAQNDNSLISEPKKRPRVLYELYVLAHYSIPLFEELSKFIDLLVIVDKQTSVDGLKNVKTISSPYFKVMELERNANHGFFHPDILKVLEEFKPDIYMSFLDSFDRILADKKSCKKIKSLGIKTVAAGCDGYAHIHHFITLIKTILSPRIPIKNTIRRIVAISRIDKFLMYSKRSADYLHIELFVPRRKIFITGNAIDTSVLNRTYHDMRSSGVKPVPYKIAYCGRLTPSKRPDILINAFSEIIEKFPEATLDMIGDGSEIDRLETMTLDLNLQNKVTFFGGLYDDKDIASRLCKCSIYVMPGLGGLGFNTAMACGLPIIYTNGDGTEVDMLRSRNIGWYFDGSIEDLKAKIASAFSNPEKMKRDGEIGEKLIVEKYSIKNMVEVYMKAMLE